MVDSLDEQKIHEIKRKKVVERDDMMIVRLELTMEWRMDTNLGSFMIDVMVWKKVAR